VAFGLRKDAKVELLSTVPLFAGLSKRQLARLASIADQLEVSLLARRRPYCGQAVPASIRLNIVLGLN
jgi:hypothetical protein